MAHRQALALPRSEKGEDTMKHSNQSCGLEVMSQIIAKFGKKVVVMFVLISLILNITFNLQIRTGEEPAY